MKKILSIILAVCIISTLLVMPVSAGTVITKDITSNATAYYMKNGGTLGTGYSGYSADKAIDGSLFTIAYGAEFNNNKSGHSSGNIIYLDLGESYNLTNVDITAATTAQYLAARAALGGTATTTQMNTSAVKFVSNVEPTISASAMTSAYTVLNNTTLASGNETYRYVGVYCPYSYGVALSEIRVLADVEVDSYEETIKQLKPVNATFKADTIKNAVNAPLNAIDGDDSTFAIADGYGNPLIVDLGVPYVITKVEIDYPTVDEVAAFITSNSLNCEAATEVNKVNNHVYLANDTVSGTSGGIKIIDSAVKGGTRTWNYTEGDTTAYRYLKIHQGSSSTPSAISEIRIYGKVIEEVEVPDPEPIEATFEGSAEFGEANGVETLRFYFTPSFTDEITDFGAYIVPFDLRSDNSERVTVNGNKAIENGKTFAADLVGIPAAAYDTTIVAVPFVVSTDGLYTFGEGVEAVVNLLK